MNVFSLFKDNKSNFDERLPFVKTMKGSRPSYSLFGNRVTNDETVSSITQKIMREYSKLTPRHIRKVDGVQVKVADNRINELLKFPNDNESIHDFLSKAAFLFIDCDNVFMYPFYDIYKHEETGKFKKVYTQIKILQPVHVDFFEDSAGKIYVDFTFASGKHSGLLDYNDIIHWRNNYGANELMGGNEYGLPNNTALLKHLQLNDQLLQSTIKTINGSLTINGILKYPGIIKKESLEKNRQEFETSLKNNETGILALDGGAEYENIEFKGQLINKDVLEFLDKKTRRHYGVSEKILDGSYSPEEKEAFYETVMEYGVLSLSAAFERVMLTKFERANGNEIVFYAGKIQNMGHTQKLALAKELKPTGGTTDNEIRSWYGLPPIEGGDEPMMSLNWVKKSIADEYQLEYYKTAKNKSTKEDNNSNNKNNNSSYNNNDDESSEEKEGGNDE